MFKATPKMLAKDYFADNIGSNSEYVLKVRGSERMKNWERKKVGE